MYNVQLMKVARFAKLMQIEKGNQEHIDLYVDLLQEEFDEFRKATRANDVIEIRDGLADIWVIATQLNMLCGWCFYDPEVRRGDASAGFEFLSSILSCNCIGTRIDGCDISDIIKWCEIHSWLKGASLANDVDEVMRSNLSKFCKTTEELNESMNHWSNKFFNVVSKPTGDPQYPFAIYSAKGNGSDYPEGKLMKPLHYVKPDLAGL